MWLKYKAHKQQHFMISLTVYLLLLVSYKHSELIMVTYVAYRGPHLQSKELHDHCQDGRSRLGTACPLPEESYGQ